MKIDITHYEINISFYANKELTQLELKALQLQITAQLEEPGDDSNYNVLGWHYTVKK